MKKTVALLAAVLSLGACSDQQPVGIREPATITPATSATRNATALPITASRCRRVFRSR